MDSNYTKKRLLLILEFLYKTIPVNAERWYTDYLKETGKNIYKTISIPTIK